MSIKFTNAGYESMIDNFAKTISRTPVTKTTSNISGEETLTDGTAANISGAFFRKEDAWSQGKEGLFQGADAIIMIKSDVSLNLNDLLTYDSQDYRVINDPITRRLGTTVFYIMARCNKV